MIATREPIRITLDERGHAAPAAMAFPAAAHVGGVVAEHAAAAPAGWAPPGWLAEAAARPGLRWLRSWRRIGTAVALTATLGVFGAVLGHAYLSPVPMTAAGGPPVIKADPTPWRLRPAEEGGLVIPNQNRLVLQDLGRSVPSPEVRGFLPAPEAPLPRPVLVASLGGGAGGGIAAGAIGAAIAATAGPAAADEIEVLLPREESQQGSTPASTERMAGLDAASAGMARADVAPPLSLVPGIAETGPGLPPPIASDLATAPVAAVLTLPVDDGLAPSPLTVETAVALLEPPAGAFSEPLPGVALDGPVGHPVLPEGIRAAFAEAGIRSGGSPAAATPDAVSSAPVFATVTPTTGIDGSGTSSPGVVAAVPDGRFAVQIAAVSSESEVAAEWDRFRRRYPGVFGALELRTQRIEGAERLGFRVQAGPLDEAGARAVCRLLQSEPTGCLVIGG